MHVNLAVHIAVQCRHIMHLPFQNVLQHVVGNLGFQLCTIQNVTNIPITSKIGLISANTDSCSDVLYTRWLLY